jgi:uncharacterized protein (TIGR02246 family)
MIRVCLIALLLIPSAILAQRGPAPEGEPTGHEAAIHATYKQFAQAWNQHDAAAMAALWTERGDHMEPDGRTVFGREEVQRLFAIEHGSVFKKSELHLAVEHVRMTSDDVAVVDGTYELFHATDTRGNAIGLRAGYFTSVVARDGDQWKVSANRLFLPQALIWRERD